MREYKILGMPFKIGRLEIKNRFCMAPLGGGQHWLSSGGLKNEAIEYIVTRARGGFGLIFTGAIATDGSVDPYTGVGPTILENVAAFKFTCAELNERANAYGARIFAQLTMGLGRNYPNLPAPSRLPVYRHPGEFSPVLTTDQISSKIESLIASAKVAREAGFAGVEVHSIHWGYLLDQFALSMMNKRTDAYGGSLENRLRAAREIVEGIKKLCGEDFPVSMRLGLKTFIKDFGKATLSGSEEMGRTIEEGVRIARLLEEYGYDCLSVDTGTYDSFYYACPPMYMPKGYALELAEKAKKAVGIPILAGGRMNDLDIAGKAIEEGKIDAIVIGRQALADPDYPNKALSGQVEKIRPCIACNQGCLTRLQQGKQPSCAVNPAAMREIRFALKPTVKKKKVAIVGGGPAGMEAARVAALRGHEVLLFEKGSSLGGNLIPGGAYSFKKEDRDLNEWYRNELRDLGVDVRLNTEATPELIRAVKADAVILATGSYPIMPKAPGAERGNVLGCLEAHDNPEKVGKKVAIIGGGLVGCEMALEYAMNGKKVTVVDALPEILSSGVSIPIPNAQMIHDLFEKYGVETLTGHRLEAMEEDGVLLRSESGASKLEADTVIIAMGFKPDRSLLERMSGLEAPVYGIGDSRKVGNILQAIWDGYEVGNNL